MKTWSRQLNRPDDRREVLIGIGALFLRHLGMFALIFIPLLFSFLLRVVVPLSMFLYFIGITQLIYAIPLYLHFKRVGRFESAKGVLIGIGITVFLNATCFGYIGVLLFLF